MQARDRVRRELSTSLLTDGTIRGLFPRYHRALPQAGVRKAKHEAVEADAALPHVL